MAPTIDEAGPKLRTLTVELEVDTRGHVTGATAWVERRVNVGKLPGVRG